MSNLDRMSRRSFVAGALAIGAAPAVAAAPIRIVATGLEAPESPKPQPDGSVILVEMMRGVLSRVLPGGRVEVIAMLGNMPNGCAFGPDGAIYVANNAAAVFRKEGGRSIWVGTKDPQGQSSIQRVDPATGHFSALYATTGQTPFVAPNDLVFDRHGGFYFSDIGAPTSARPGAVYYARADGGGAWRIADVPMANGIVLSPGGDRLRVASGSEIVEFAIAAPGKLVAGNDGRPHRRSFGRIAAGMLDSMAALADGGLVAGTLFPGGLSAFAADGALDRTLPIPLDPAVTNIGFGGRDMRSAFVTLTQTGQLAEIRWPTPGLKLAYQR